MGSFVNALRVYTKSIKVEGLVLIFGICLLTGFLYWGIGKQDIQVGTAFLVIFLSCVFLTFPPFILILYKTAFMQSRYSLSDLKKYFVDYKSKIDKKESKLYKIFLLGNLIFRSLVFLVFSIVVLTYCIFALVLFLPTLFS
jgi:hypothetical protein